MTNTISVCPECDKTKVQPRHKGSYSDQPKAKPDCEYYCSACDAYFDTPAERERQGHGKGGSATVSKLREMNVEVDYE